MAKIKIGKIPVYKGEYDNNTTYNRLNQVTYLGTTFLSIVDDNLGHPPAEKSEDGGEITFINTNYWDIIAKGIDNVEERTATDNSMGYKILKKNKSFAEQVIEENTIYEIRYDFTLTGNVTIPANCVLEFNGGSISGAYTLTGNNTGIHSNSNSIFGDNITISGTWNIPIVYGEWIENVRNTNNLRKAVALLSSGNKLVVGTGIHNLSLTEGDSTGISLPNNTELQIEGEIKANTNNLTSYMIVSPGENCYIHGGKITGDKDTSEATKGEYGHGITIWSNNVKIESVEISNCWGDGVCVYRKCTVEKCIIHDCRRQGISVCYGDETKILRNNIYNIRGTAPQSCIDVEPNDENHPISGIEISGNYLHDSQGAGVFLFGMNGTVEDIKVINNVFEGCGMTITAAKHVFISNNTIKYFSIANIQKSDGVIFESNMYIPNLTESYSKALNLDYDNKDIVLNNNIFNYNIPSAIDLKNCIFTNNKLIKAKLTIRNGVVARNNYINGEINVYTVDGGDTSYVCNNTFFVKGEGELFAFMTYNAATGSFYFCNNEVTIDYDVLRAFYYGDTRYLDSQLFSVFVEKDNNYNVPQYTNFYRLKYTKGVRTNNFDVRQKKYNDYFNDLKVDIEDYGVFKRVYDGNNNTIEHINTDGFTYALNRGTTAERPTSSLTTDDEGFRYFDTTLHKPIWYKGDGTWIDATGTPI